MFAVMDSKAGTDVLMIQATWKQGCSRLAKGHNVKTVRDLLSNGSTYCNFKSKDICSCFLLPATRDNMASIVITSYYR